MLPTVSGAIPCEGASAVAIGEPAAVPVGMTVGLGAWVVKMAVVVAGAWEAGGRLQAARKMTREKHRMVLDISVLIF